MPINRPVTMAMLLIASVVIQDAFAGQAQDVPSGKADTVVTAGAVTTLADDIDAGAGGLTIDSDGNLYTADFGWRLDGGGKGGDRVFRIDADGTATVFVRGLQGASGNTIDGDGNLYQSSIRGAFISMIAPSGQSKVVAQKGLSAPVGIAIDDTGNLFVCNCGSNVIQRIAPDGTSSVFCNSTLFQCPNGITRADDGTLYVCNFGNGDVIKVSSDGKAERLATLPGNNNGHLTLHDGELFVVARSDNRIYRINRRGEAFVLAGTGQRGDHDGPADEATFSLPNSIVVADEGNTIYVNETSPTSGDPRILGPTRVRKIELVRQPADEVALTPIIQPNPRLASLMQQGQRLIAQQDFVGAESVYRKALKEFGHQPAPAFMLGYALHAQKKYDEAIVLFESTATQAQTKTTSLYNLACIYSLQNKPDEAFRYLEKAIAAGFSNFAQMQADADFDNIKGDARFRKLIPEK